MLRLRAGWLDGDLEGTAATVRQHRDGAVRVVQVPEDPAVRPGADLPAGKPAALTGSTICRSGSVPNRQGVTCAAAGGGSKPRTATSAASSHQTMPACAVHSAGVPASHRTLMRVPAAVTTCAAVRTEVPVTR
ncbi:hypothetical protein GCM10027610_047350 [Dactylosporangium cerinum]